MDTAGIRTKLLNAHPNFSGVISYSEQDTVLFEEAFGLAVVNEEVPNQIHTRFPMASGSKIFTAAAVLKLVEEGRLSLEDPVAYYLPDHFPHMDEHVTLWHLLTHTSGFMDYFDEEENDDYSGIWKDLPMYSMKNPDDFLVLLGDREMEFSPGERFKYNNGAFVILSMVIEHVSERKFVDYVSENIFEAANMDDSGYFPMNNLPKGTAVGYTENENGTLISNIYSIPIIGGGDGGGYTTAGDLRRFWTALTEGKILKDELVRAMITAHIAADDEGDYYGLGVWIRKKEEDTETIYIVGADPGISMISQFNLTDRKTLTVLSNQDDEGFNVRRTFLDLINKE